MSSRGSDLGGDLGPLFPAWHHAFEIEDIGAVIDEECFVGEDVGAPVLDLVFS